MSNADGVRQDLLGRELKVGDWVATVKHGLILGTIIKFTPKQVRIEYAVKTKYGSFTSTVLNLSTNTIKVDGPDLTMHLLRRGY